MKTFYKRIVLITCLVLLSSMHAFAQISKVEIVATGLTCSMCSNAINKQLKSMVDVESVTTDLNTNTFFVQLKANNTLTPKALKASIEKTGFFIGSMILTLDLGNFEVKESQKIQKDSGTYVFVDAATKSVNGSMQVRVLNDGFVTKKEFKKSSKMLLKYAELAAQENTYLIKTI